MFKAREFALRGSGARLGISDQFRGIDAPIGLAEKHAQNALLRLRKQRVRQAFAAGAAVSAPDAQYGCNHARYGQTVNAKKPGQAAAGFVSKSACWIP